MTSPMVLLRAPQGAQFVFASSSNLLKNLLAQIGLFPDLVDNPKINKSPFPTEPVRIYAMRIAISQAQLVAYRYPDSFVLAVSKVVACGRRILPKTYRINEARQCLKLLSGRRHRVIGGICVIDPHGKGYKRLVETRVGFKRLSDAEIDAYLNSGEWFDQDGGYTINGLTGAYVNFLNGSYFNAIGLDLAKTYSLLNGLGFAYLRTSM
ncbi:maf-like family protein [Candidatus Endolissoclinum faulkneri L2]|uniref:Nucleoside triphosphate pyrophosphatase n=1 Tax=Candidatus Endolissoclinum faulkneri L2 TaxID=1193729 RepID=K7Z3G7_9PROT|nr:Maf family protein [Candidatus Endolissoclinum faulkneri]AFX98513.1 maf-like family protein [Candidatus Endolissoclinum faulkneri L2]